jgi:hypothetical protein
VKLIKMFGLAMVAVIATMAMIGAAGASAKTVEFCTKAENNCTPANRYALPHALAAKLKAGTTAELVGTFPVKCTESTTGGKVNTAENEKQAVGVIETLTFSKCTLLGGGCTVTAFQLPYTLHVWQDETTLGNGHMSIGPEKQGALQPGAKLVCGATTCEFKASEEQDSPFERTAFEKEKVWANMQITGGAPAIVRTVNQAGATTILKRVGGSELLCGKTAEWKAEYEITEPNPLFIVHQTP